MFYTAELFINLNDPNHLDECHIANSYENYDDAFQWMIDHHSGIMLGACPSSPRTEGNAVEGAFVDIFNEYRRIYLLINAESYFYAEDIAIQYALDYINDRLKERWLETYEHKPSDNPALE